MNDDVLWYLEYGSYLVLIVSFLFLMVSFVKKKNTKLDDSPVVVKPQKQRLNKYEEVLNKYDFDIVSLNDQCEEPYAIVNVNEELKQEFEENEIHSIIEENGFYKILFKFEKQISTKVFNSFEENKYTLNAVLLNCNNKDKWMVILNNKIYSNDNNIISENEYIKEVFLNEVKIISNEEEILVH